MGRRLRTLTIAAAVLTVALPTVAYADDEDSPWPDSESNQVQLAATRRVVRQLEHKVELMQLSAARYATWETCIRGVPVSEYGDSDRQFGYAYDERDGSGRSFMPALAVDRKRRRGREDYLFLDFARTRMCRSETPQPGGTADAASTRRPLRAGPTGRPGGSLRALERRARRLRRQARRLDAASERFDAWESCVSWVPVTEYGDPDGGFGYLFGARGSSAFSFRPALSIDRSDGDDPDYMFLAFVGGDRPGHVCQNDPGEADD
jgi:hypothetical protein